MILKEYFHKLNKEDVLDEVIKLYPTSNRQAYSEAWDEILTIDPAPIDKMIICATHVIQAWSDDADLGVDDYINISGEKEDAHEDICGVIRKGRDITWAVELTAWEQWLGWEVENNTAGDPRCVTDDQLLAHIFWEMTFCGYTQCEIDSERDMLKERIAEIDEWEKEGTLDDHLIPIDEDFIEKIDKLIDDCDSNVNASS